MNCPSCATLIEVELEEAGIKAKCSYAKETLEVESENTPEEKIKNIINKSDYDLSKT